MSCPKILDQNGGPLLRGTIRVALDAIVPLVFADSVGITIALLALTDSVLALLQYVYCGIKVPDIESPLMPSGKRFQK